MESLLGKAGYLERSYWSIPGGIAIVTRLEHINKDGKPFSGTDRWQETDGYLTTFSFSSYFRALFTAREGYYRVIIFTITDQGFRTSNEILTAQRADDLLSQGFNVLAQEVAARPLPTGVEVTSLIYEFERGQGDPTQVVPSPLGAKDHLVQQRVTNEWR